MKKIPKEQIVRRIRLENQWWIDQGKLPLASQKWTPRPYLDLFYPLVESTAVRRAVVLMGPRRVGKTVLIHHCIGTLIKKGFPPSQIVYFSVDHPLYNGLGLEQMLDYYKEASGTDHTTKPIFVFFDEIQYLKNWEVHLKSLVDSYPSVKAIATGSAAAALKLKSLESGAGRFTDFHLPPLTFYEYLSLLNKNDLLVQDKTQVEGTLFKARDINELNRNFIEYLNFGGYPEVMFSPEIQQDPGRFIKADIIDKVLLRDLPSLYGIQDIQELNQLFTTLAFNTASEVSLEGLSQGSGVAKNTIKRYIEYLEAAFLLRIVHRVDYSGKRFKRANFFKIYLTNPSIHSALFAPLKDDDEKIGALVETGIFSQWFHSEYSGLHYARWQAGEVDIVHLDIEQKIAWALEVKWSDRITTHPSELKHVVGFCQANKLKEVMVTTRTVGAAIDLKGIEFEFLPASEYCYTVGFNIISRKKDKDPLSNPLK